MRSSFGIVVIVAALIGCSSGADTATEAAPAAPTTVAPSVTTEAAPTTVAATTTTAAATTTAAPETTTPETTTTVDLTADRPFEVFVPSGYDEATATPLVILLHGYSASGDGQEAYFQFQPLAEERGFLYVHPDGLKDPRSNQFWNATDACCNFADPKPDDSAYLAAIIEQVEATYNVDPKRIFVAGHSNGGFMSYRMACDHADKVAAIASLAGATFADVEACTPSEPVSVLQIHGTVDETIQFMGADIDGNAYPSAATSVETWAAYNDCGTTSPAPGDVELDLDGQVEGAETMTAAFADCPDGIGVELWTINGGPHIPAISPVFAPAVIDFLLAHPKP